MKNLTEVKGFIRSHAGTLFLTGVLTMMISSCNPDNNKLGRDLLPPDDNISVYYDTIGDISTFPVFANHIRSSETYGNPQASRTFLLGSRKDSIFGKARAEIVTQYDLSNAVVFGPNMAIDSVMLWMYFSSVEGDTLTPFHIRVFELLDDIYMDSVYYSDYDVSGKYDPVPLVDQFILPVSDSLYAFRIADSDFRNRILNPEHDSLFVKDSIFKLYFKGLYITAEPVVPVTSFSRIQLSNAYTRLGIHYTSDSVDVDTTDAVEYAWYFFNINEYYSQKINIYRHDFTGTAIGKQLGNEAYGSDFLYVQGMSGVNTKIRFNGLESWKDSGTIAINSAYLTLEVVPEEISGIPQTEWPSQLFLLSQMKDSTYQAVYDYLINSTVFGGKLEKIATGNVFVSDSIYVYRFNIGLQLQSMIDGSSDNTDLILQVYNPLSNPGIVKLWSNYADRKGRLKLEVVYSKL